MNWDAARDAIVAWLQAGSGLSRVIWSHQDKGKPAKDFITVRATLVRPVGQDDVLQSQDLSRVGNGTTTVGTEIQHTVAGLRELHLSVQAFTESAVLSPVSLLSRTQTALRLDSVRSALIAAGLAPFHIGEPRDISALLDDKHEGRAVMECRFYFTETVSDFSTFIGSAPVEWYTGPPDSGTADEIDI